MATWNEICAQHPKVFCAHCATRDDCHATETQPKTSRWACHRLQDDLVLVGLMPDDMRWVDFVTEETNGEVTVDLHPFIDTLTA